VLKIINELQEKATASGISEDEAFALYTAGNEYPYHLFSAASALRERFKGKTIGLCGIVNAKSGRCSEDCKFCAQSSHYETQAPVYPLLSSSRIVREAEALADNGVKRFGIVTSGKKITGDRQWREILTAVEQIGARGIQACASLGIIDRARMVRLKNAGLYRYHHNLETSRSFFPNICTTHDYEEDVETVRVAKGAGLSVCSGGLIGLGETIHHRIEMAFTLKELDVDSVPVNILNPIPGTPLADIDPLSPLEILITIAVFRFILPSKDIKLCGGKEKNLRQLLPLSILAGCNSLMTGNYLTTTGRNAGLDLEMIRDLGLIPA